MKQLAFALFTIGILTGSSAFAADMATKAAPAPPAPATTWTGFYVGANGGWGGKDPTVTFAPNDFLLSATTCGGSFGGTCAQPASFNLNGALGGLQIGYNRQIDQTWLLGLEADFDWSTIKGTGISPNFNLASATANAQFVASENIDWFGTVQRPRRIPAAEQSAAVCLGRPRLRTGRDACRPEFFDLGSQRSGNFLQLYLHRRCGSDELFRRQLLAHPGGFCGRRRRRISALAQCEPEGGISLRELGPRPCHELLSPKRRSVCQTHRRSRPATAWLISMWSGAGSTGNSIRRCAFFCAEDTPSLSAN
jgi:hypothetical protein